MKDEDGISIIDKHITIIDEKGKNEPDLSAGHPFGICNTCGGSGNLTKLGKEWLCPICFIFQVNE